MGIVAYVRALTGLGPRYVVVTDGARGAFAASRDEILFAPAVKTSTIGTAGAGDAFAATFVTFVASGRAIDEALRAATINAASVVGYIDTQSGLLGRDALEQRVNSPEAPVVRRWEA